MFIVALQLEKAGWPLLVVRSDCGSNGVDWPVANLQGCSDREVVKQPTATSTDVCGSQGQLVRPVCMVYAPTLSNGDHVRLSNEHDASFAVCTCCVHRVMNFLANTKISAAHLFAHFVRCITVLGCCAPASPF